MGESRRLGVGEASRLAARLPARLPDLIPGAGEAEASRPRGLGRAMVEELDLLERRGTGGFRWGEGVVAERGLNLWPTSRSFVFVLLFHRGLLFFGAGEGPRGGIREAGVGVREERVGDVTEDRGMDDALLLLKVETGWGRLE